MKTKKNLKYRLVEALTCCLVYFAGTNLLYAQDTTQAKDESGTTLTGCVFDAATRQPLAGVRIEGFGNNRHTTMSKPDGTFSITVPNYITSLYVSTPGFNSVVIPAKAKEHTIYLYDESFKSFNENDFKVNSQSEANVGITTATTIEQEIEDKLGAEVRTITRSGTVGMGSLMLMQGLNSLNTSAQPLIILDGVIQDLQDSYASVHDGFFNNILAGIDVDDIQKITVLKNATSIYGAKGGNGVILIDTKRGQSMATKIDASIYGGYTLTPKLPSMMDAAQYRIYSNELMGGVTTNQTRFPFLWDNDNYYYNMYHNETNWSDYIYQEAWSQNYKVNVQGGDEAAMYNFSLGYTDGESTIKCNDFNRLNIRFNTDISLSKMLKTRFDIAYTRIVRNLRDDGIQADYNSGPISSPGFLSLIKSPFLSPYKYTNTGVLTNALDAADSFANIDAYTSNNSYANPLSILEYAEGNNKNNQEYTVFDVTMAPELDLKNGLKLTSLFNYTLHRTNEKYFRPMTGTPTFIIEGLGTSQNEVRSFFSKESSIYSDTRLAWTKNQESHYWDIFAGFRFSNFAYDSNYQSCHNTGNDKLPDIKKDYSFLDEAGEYTIWRNMAWYANIDYNFRHKYYLQASLAAETSSRFGRDTEDGIKVAGVSWGLFPSIQAGWLVSAEPFFNTNVFNYMKLTAGFDMSGNDNISNNAAYSYFSNVRYQGKAMGLVLSNIENQSIQWETTSRYNVGIEAVTLNNRLKIEADLFLNQTDDLLTLKSLKYNTGLKNYWCNGGSLENKGFDVNLTGKLINAKSWKWELGASAGHYKNEITALPDGKTYNSAKDGALYGHINSIYNATILSAVGQSAGVFFGWETDGVFATAADATAAGLSTEDALTGKKTAFEAGDVHFVDQNNDKVINDEDRVVIGNPNPDFYGNIFSNLSYKNWTLSATVNYVYGNDVYNYQRSQLESGSTFFNQTLAECNRWKTEGDVTDVPRATYGDPKSNNRFSDRWIEDGSYLRLKNVKLSYKVPVSTSWLQGLVIWCAGNNLLTLTNYLGNDPEFSFSNNVLYQGIDNGLLSQSRSFHVGVKINL